jgi:hypothetical protein
MSLGLLKFLYLEENVDQWLMDRWLGVYDRAFVDEEVVGAHRRLKVQLDALVEELSVAVSGRGLKEGEDEAEGRRTQLTKPPTVPVPFALTAPRPRRVPVPKRIENTFSTKPVPLTNYEPDGTQAKVEAARAEAKARSLAVHSQAKAPALTEPDLARRAALVASVQAERAAELEKTKVKAVPPPRHPAGHGPVRLNAAAVLREDALFAKKQDKEVAAIKEFELNLRDAREFLEWQRGVRERDEVERLAAVERRRLEMALSSEAAREAREGKREENAVVVKEMLRAKEEAEEKARAEAQAERDRAAALALQIRESHANAGQAKRKAVSAKRRAARTVAEETRELELKKAEDLVFEQIRLKEHILRVRAEQDVVKERVRVVDLTETSGMGLLNEMSVLEVRERIALDKRVERERTEAKNRAIQEAKEAKAEELRAKAERIARFRAQAGAENRQARAERQASELQQKVALELAREPAVAELSAKLEAARLAKQQAAQAVAEKERATRVKAQFLAQSRGQVEAKLHQSGDDGKARTARAAQQAEILMTVVSDETKRHASEQLALVREREQQRVKENRDRVTTQAEQAKRDAQREADLERERLRAAVELQKTSMKMAEETRRQEREREVQKTKDLKLSHRQEVLGTVVGAVRK